MMCYSPDFIKPEGAERRVEIEKQKIEAPVFVVGLPRSGTTIMEEILGADPNARSVHMWEAKFPVPPPHPNDPKPDPRIARADALVGLTAPRGSATPLRDRGCREN